MFSHNKFNIKWVSKIQTAIKVLHTDTDRWSYLITLPHNEEDLNDYLEDLQSFQRETLITIVRLGFKEYKKKLTATQASSGLYVIKGGKSK